MEKIDRIIQIIRENMVANSPGTGGGFSTESDPFGPVAGKSPKLFGDKVQKRYMKGKRKYWLDYLRTSNGRRNQSSNS